MPTTISGNTGVSQVQAASITAADLDGAQTGSAPIYGCRAWVNFDGTKDTTGATSTANTNRLILGSGNVTSVLRNGTGDYTVTFTTAMSDVNYAVVNAGSGGSNPATTRNATVNTGTFTTSSVNLKTSQDSGAAGGVPVDFIVVSIAVFR